MASEGVLQDVGKELGEDQATEPQELRHDVEILEVVSKRTLGAAGNCGGMRVTRADRKDGGGETLMRVRTVEFRVEGVNALNPGIDAPKAVFPRSIGGSAQLE